MLTSLTVRQFALMQGVQLELDAGMTVFTGETGAGKSILIDALGAAFGARASADWVRHGAERAEVIATWQGQEGSPVDEKINDVLKEQDIEPEEELILRRIIGKDGRSRAYLNGVPVSLKVLQAIGNLCLDLHGQHEHQALLQPGFQRQLIDSGVSEALLASVADAHRCWQAAQTQLASHNQDRGETEQQAAWMREELARLEGLSIEEGLAEALQQEVDAGRHHAQIQQSAAEALTLLDEGAPSARQLLADACHSIAQSEDYHPGLLASRKMMDQMDAILGELTGELHQVLDDSFDEAGLHAAEERLMQLHEAMRRHDVDESGLLSLMEAWQQRLSALDTAAWDETALQERCDKAEADYRKAASALSAARKKQAGRLCKALRPFLDRLALAGMQVTFEVRPQEQPSGWLASGWDEVEMMLMSNPGEPWRPLAAVASGGELSRLVLALKGCGAVADMPHIAVFDEVDTGIGGETAWCVGELLAAMGHERQVLVISHLPQVAAIADAQIVIRKAEQDGRTTTSLEPLASAQRQPEIARMLGGQDEESVQHAAKMLERGDALRTSVAGA
ncbi:MAG: DNA repair protein RecN [Mariprofundaceae bacterium]